MSLTWTLVTVSLAQLHPWEGNPKTTTRKQAGQLVTSRDDLGQFQTVAISPFDAAGLALVYDGHQRLSAWRQAYGPDFTIQALQASRPLTAQEQRKVAIYSRQIGAWDWDILSGWEPTELTAWGFDTDLLTDWRRDVAALGNFIGSEEVDYDELWEGMPEFEQEQLNEIRIIVYFPDNHAKQDFSKILNIPLTAETKFIWFPKESKPMRQSSKLMRVEYES